MLINPDFDGVFVDSLSQLITRASQKRDVLGRHSTPQDFARQDFATIHNLTSAKLGKWLGIPDHPVDD